MTLAKAYERLLSLEFPEHPESDGLSDLLLELAEVDGCISGLAQRALSGGRVAPGDIPNLAQLGSALELIQISSPGDRPILDAAQIYLQALQGVRDGLLRGR